MAGGAAQGYGPEFKPQYRENKKKLVMLSGDKIKLTLKVKRVRQFWLCNHRLLSPLRHSSFFTLFKR
jgi:hypothetical protein